MAGTYDWIWDQGTTIDRMMVWKRDGVIVDMTGWTARMEIRDRIGGTLLFRLDTTNGRLTVGSNGMGLNISHLVSSAWDWRSGLYDLEVIDANGRIGRLLEGKVKIRPEITTGD